MRLVKLTVVERLLIQHALIRLFSGIVQRKIPSLIEMIHQDSPRYPHLSPLAGFPASLTMIG